MKATAIQKAHELAYARKVRTVMTRDPIIATPKMTMREVAAIMRDERISGLPVMDAGQLVGIISLQDLITALERRALNATVGGYMTQALHTVREDQPVIYALQEFARSGVGRLPVLDAEGRLVGILTPGDITRGILHALQDAFQEEEMRRYRASQVFEDIPSERTSVVLRYTVAPGDFGRAGQASSTLKQALNRIGLDPGIVRRAAIASYEAEMNVVIHSSAGGELTAEVTPQSLSIVVTDGGPGIPDVERAMQPGFSTAPDRIREMGFGAGMGLSNIRSCADEMRLESAPGTGTCLEAIFYLTPNEGTTRDASQ